MYKGFEPLSVNYIKLLTEDMEKRLHYISFTSYFLMDYVKSYIINKEQLTIL